VNKYEYLICFDTKVFVKILLENSKRFKWRETKVHSVKVNKFVNTTIGNIKVLLENKQYGKSDEVILVSRDALSFKYKPANTRNKRTNDEKILL